MEETPVPAPLKTGFTVFARPPHFRSEGCGICEQEESRGHARCTHRLGFDLGGPLRVRFKLEERRDGGAFPAQFRRPVSAPCGSTCARGCRTRDSLVLEASLKGLILFVEAQGRGCAQIVGNPEVVPLRRPITRTASAIGYHPSS